jgi:trehalose-6-phosphate synthase
MLVDDERIWKFEEELWVGGDDVYHQRVSDDCLMALPAQPYLFAGEQATKAVQDTPKWDTVEFAEKQLSRPQEGLIIIAYRIKAKRQDQSYHALCTSTLRRLAHEEWDVVQHQQTPLGVIVADPDEVPAHG